jgi:Flp pilus assembly protein TadB
MARIPTLVPRSLVRWLKSLFSGRLVDIVWKLLVLTTVAVAVVYMAALGGPLYVVLAGTIISVLLSDRVRRLFLDVWERDFWIWRL